jgi:hypothetical protein
MPRDREWAMRIMRDLEAYRTPKLNFHLCKTISH